MGEVGLRCECGRVAGAARDPSPRTGLRVVCMCDDCQTFAHFLGDAARRLDGCGGSDVFQFTPARLTLTEGADQLRCVCLGPRGPLRFYTACCRTPVANVMRSPSAAFASVSRWFFDLDDAGLDATLGHVRFRVMGEHGRPPLPAGTQARMGFATLAVGGWNLLRGWLRGEARPSPFHRDDGEPAVTPELMTLEERRRLRAEAGFPG